MSRKRQRGRAINGILLLDKPAGLTSNKALQIVKAIYQAQKAGHTGSLDPLATGMLPICFGEATKISNYLLEAKKRYRFTCQLGTVTTTGDAEGEIISSNVVPALSTDDIEIILQQFRGDIEQVPPMYSALKHNGERLYDLARQGIEVERKPRSVTIYELKLIRLQGDQLELEAECSKGTYIRTLAQDIGEQLGCGATISALHRLVVGPFVKPEAMISLAELESMQQQDRDALLLPIDSALMKWPEVQLNADLSFYVAQGQPVQVPKAPTHGLVRLYNADKQQFLGIGQIKDDGKVAPKRLFNYT
jgi:tRNA pseudouridine55 synthase